MRISTARFLSCYTFLAYDSIDLFSKEMWIDFIDIEKVREIIRKELSPFLLTDIDYFKNSLNIVSRITNILMKELGECFYKLSWWIRNIYIDGGPDRISEMIWSDLSLNMANTPNKYINLDGSLKAQMIDLGEECRKHRKYISKKIDGVESHFTTVFNKKVIELLQLDENCITTTISLISTSNIFVDLWDKKFGDLSFDDQLKLFCFGKEVHQEEMDGIDITFPGSWKYEIDEYR